MPSTHNIRVSDAVYQSLKAEATSQRRTMSAVLERLLPPWQTVKVKTEIATPEELAEFQRQHPKRVEDHDGIRVTYGISRTDARRDLTYEDEK